MANFPDWTGMPRLVEARLAELVRLIIAADPTTSAVIRKEAGNVAAATGLANIVAMTPEIDRALRAAHVACIALAGALSHFSRAPAEHEAALAAMAALLDALRGADLSPSKRALFD